MNSRWSLTLCYFLLLSYATAQRLTFEQWAALYGKTYRSPEDASKAKQTFEQNVKLVSHLNDLYKEKDVKYAINSFADLTPEEFEDKILMPARKPPVHPAERYVSFEAGDLPDTFDWRDKDVVSSVKDQGSVGTCWAFSTVGNVEGQWALAGHPVISLATEQLVDCDATIDPDNLNSDCGVFGGWPYLAYQYIANAGGIEEESAYPYCSGSGQCYPCVPKGYNKTRCGPPPSYCNKTDSCDVKLNNRNFVSGLKVKSWIAIAKNETEMMAALVSTGPLSVLIDASTLQFYHSGVWDPLVCDSTDLDHAVLLVGYGTDKGILSSKPYWLIKNSWGEKWGEEGYFMMLRGAGKCGVDQAVTSATLE
ncbi:hypothetical protein EMCRGX_G014320 [Ephydatia muelleri]